VEIITQRPTIGSFLNSGTQRTSLSEQAPSARNYETAQSAAGWQTVIVYADHIETALARRWNLAQILAHHGRYFASLVAIHCRYSGLRVAGASSLNFDEAKDILLLADQIDRAGGHRGDRKFRATMV